MSESIFKREKMVRYLSATLRGSSRAQFMSSEDGTQYVVKFKENFQGIRVLVNELVANGIGCELNLPCPEGIIAEIDRELIEISNIENTYGRKISSGQHYGCKKIEGCYPVPPRILIDQANNKNVFPGIVLFDILTFNHNRNNQGNYLIQQARQDSFDFYIIDHGHCFGRPNWHISIIQKIGTWNGNVLPEVANCIMGSDPFRNYIERIQNLSNEFFSKIVDEIPAEWGISNNERNALKSFLMGQRDRIKEIIFQYKNLFPNWT